jgi:hypothetical protein
LLSAILPFVQGNQPGALGVDPVTGEPISNPVVDPRLQ